MPASCLRRALASSLSAIALVATPLALAPSPADAGGGTSWDCLARYESSQRWHLNSGNGYYGGVQFSRSTWRYYGGKHLTGTRWPHRASKAAQIRIGKRVAHTGWMSRPAQGGRNAWPNTWPRCH